MTLAAPKMPSNLCGKEKLRVSGTVIKCFFASATCSTKVTSQSSCAITQKIDSMHSSPYDYTHDRIRRVHDEANKLLN